jgi:hypothetical protein
VKIDNLLRISCGNPHFISFYNVLENESIEEEKPNATIQNCWLSKLRRREI